MQQLYDKHTKNKLGGYNEDLERKDIQKFMDEDLAGYSPQSKKRLKECLILLLSMRLAMDLLGTLLKM